MLNMTALKISLEKSEKEAAYYSLGVSLIIVIQSYLAIILTKYVAEHPNFLESLEKAGVFIFIILSFYFYKQSKKGKIEVKDSDTKKGNSFFTGITLSLLNMFAIPFFCGTATTLDIFNLFSFDEIPVTFFIIGSVLGTFYILFLYGKYAKKIQKKVGKLIKDINLILSVLTGLVAVFSLLKIFLLND
tara:strand:- start:483 stop:1046 length:564 start_codon:yes stop_codon:yes gene_type:complete